MWLLVTLLQITLIIWIALLIVMLPVYLYRKKKNPNDNKNTFTQLVIKALLASLIFTLIFCCGLIAMYLDQ